jgi:hypothetical protein
VGADAVLELDKKIDTPKTETPRTDAAKVEAPKVEAAKAETAKQPAVNAGIPIVAPVKSENQSPPKASAPPPIKPLSPTPAQTRVAAAPKVAIKGDRSTSADSGIRETVTPLPEQTPALAPATTTVPSN